MDNTQRFTTRVGDYVKYRPGYPGEIVQILAREHQLEKSSAIVDIGSGTGMFTRLFLEHGNPVFGVEPNAAMRAAGEEYLSTFAGFVSVNGTAEATTLPNACADFITAGQAFHWFDPPRTKAEFRRIGKPAARVVLVWNTWYESESPFMLAYREVVHRNSTESLEGRHSLDRQVQAVLQFFAPSRVARYALSSGQSFDFEALVGRVRSASYAPNPGDPRYDRLVEELRRIFDRHQRNGEVAFELKTHVFVGTL
jgi:SAM-dependent methyltransferase